MKPVVRLQGNEVEMPVEDAVPNFFKNQRLNGKAEDKNERMQRVWLKGPAQVWEDHLLLITMTGAVEGGSNGGSLLS